MKHKLVKTGHSKALLMQKLMLRHLGNADADFVDVQLIEDAIIIRAPRSVGDAIAITEERYGNALSRLAQAPDALER